MAKKSTNQAKRKTVKSADKSPKSDAHSDVVDAEVVSETAADSPTDLADETKESISETDATAETAAAEELPDKPKDESAASNDTIEKEELKTSAYSPTPATQEQRSVVGPVIIGCILAGILGYGISSFQNQSVRQDLESRLSEQLDVIGNLRTDVTALKDLPDATDAIEQVAVLNGAVSDLESRIDTDFSAVLERIDVLERQPSADGTLQETAIAAFEEDMTELRDQILAQQSEMAGLLSRTREEAQAIEAGAIASARAATARTALAVIQSALETGAPLGAALNDLEGALVDGVPDGIINAKDGVVTLAVLQEEFPQFAREALSIARSEGVSGEESGGVSSFFRSQFDVRSVEPKEGTSVDAILSRAEAALKQGRLNDTLAEVASLPEVAKGVLTNWTSQAEQRAAAIDAAVTLASQLNVN